MMYGIHEVNFAVFFFFYFGTVRNNSNYKQFMKPQKMLSILTVFLYYTN